ncbi:MAG: tRNA (adenosine(37)-N6)-threonylcarbamoyltransferase complex ATPase subunit type 1 TsaE [Bacteroidota bacterium]
MSSIFISSAEYHRHGMEAWQHALKDYLPRYLDERIWCLYGDLGAGKTTFVQSFCAYLGVTDRVKSPTFGLLHEYFTPQKEPIYHLDLYRIKDKQEALDIGLEEYLYSGAYCLIEWPKIIASSLSVPRLDLFFSHEEEGIKVVSYDRK